MKDFRILLISTAIKNIVAIICFTLLAVIFKKWWVILFSILFQSNVEYKKSIDEENNK